MAEQKILKLLHESFSPVIENLNNNVASQFLYGIDGSLKNLLISGITVYAQRPVLVVTTTLEKAEKIYEDVSNFFPEEKALLFPPRENIYHEMLTYSKEITEQRLFVIDKILKKESFLVIAPLNSLPFPLPPKDTWKKHFLKITRGSNTDLNTLTEHLYQLGYKETSLVENKGHFNVKKDLLDFYPAISKNPYRVKLANDKVESIREFDSLTQRSKSFCKEACITPVREIVLNKEEFQEGYVKLEKDFENRHSFLLRSGEKEAANNLREKLEKHLEKIKENIYFDGIEQYLPYFYPKLKTLLDYMPEKTLFFIDEPVHVLKNEEKLKEKINNNNNLLLKKGVILPKQANLYHPVNENLFSGQPQNILFSYLKHSKPEIVKPKKTINVPGKSTPNFQGKWDVIKEEIDYWLAEGYRVYIAVSSSKRGQSIIDSCKEQGLKIAYAESAQKLSEDTLRVILCNLGNGFILPGSKLVFLTEHEIIPQKKKKKLWKSSGETKISDYHALEVGDYIVHEHNGIGKYLGVYTLTINNTSRDYLFLEYAGEDKLYIPVDQISLVSKYVGAEDKSPKLHSLGSNEWPKIKNKVKNSVQEMAKDLHSLYTTRQSISGYAFSSDHRWQKYFEARFPYSETPDQLKVIDEIKKDMESFQPMDRLVCGDVGYGKTEISMRAAFKAVMDGKQVAVLVPTTILAQQHYQNFKERFLGFPVNIEVLNRFKKGSEQKKIIRKVKSGWTDIIIGTHRLLSSDVSFNNLGLLAIDEEQRFGVHHKEKLRILKKNMDVINMTATPIPRTLHMSLTGIRDLSIIETPPEDRYPIQTYVVEHSEALIKDAVLRELSRGGQIYFIYNYVESIEKWEKKLKEIVPEARIGIAHGQMSEDRLEDVMHSFLNKDCDILLSTTIVEAGLDIPNVNTIIIYDADKMGLAQLYQLRGRVGRSNRLAYAYLTFQKDKELSEIAEKRLNVIKEFTELGSGFKIALRDLGIRGAGNVLGSEQRGFMFSVGFDFYCQLLEQSLKEMGGVKTEEERDIRLEIDVDAFIPDSYVPYHSQKMYIYQKLVSAKLVEEIDSLEDELNDCYGEPPVSVKNILAMFCLKIYAKHLNISLITQEKDFLIIKLFSDFAIDSKDLFSLTESFKNNFELLINQQVGFKLDTRDIEKEKSLSLALDFCETLSRVLAQPLTT